MYLVQCKVAQKKTDGAETLLKDAILQSSSTETALRAVAYNALGDYYREKGQKDDAFWAYLRVDTLYNGDVNEHAKAHLLSVRVIQGQEIRRPYRRPEP